MRGNLRRRLGEAVSEAGLRSRRERLLRRQGYSSGGRSRVRRTVTPQTTRNPRTMAPPNRMNTMGMTVQYPAGSGVGVSVLPRQPHGFEGFRLADVELHVDYQSVPERKDPCAFYGRKLDPRRAPAQSQV